MNALHGNRETRHRTSHGWKAAPPACFQSSEAGPMCFQSSEALRKMTPVSIAQREAFIEKLHLVQQPRQEEE